MKKVDLIVWDEVVMCDRNCLEAVDRTLHDLRNNQYRFGGATTLFSGDYRQLLPIIPGGSRGQIVNATFNRSPLQNWVRKLVLDENMRLMKLMQDPNADEAALQYPNWLLELGAGHHNRGGNKEVEIPSSINIRNNIRGLCKDVYEGIEQHRRDDEWMTSRGILTTRNASLCEINKVVGERIPGTLRRYLSADSVDVEYGEMHNYSIEFLNSIPGDASLPDNELEVKVGYPVMLLRNLDTKNGHVNGARYIVERSTGNLLFLRLACGKHKGNKLALPRVPCSAGREDFGIPGFKRVQFPVRVCFAMTINKAQGQTFGSKVGIDVVPECFSHGQLYVALSRATHPNLIYLRKTDLGRKTINVVLREVIG